MKIYCINLDRSTDRLAHMQATFARLGLEFERFAAVDGNEAVRTYGKVMLYEGNREFSPGELGCFLSHRTIWKKIAEGVEPFAAVFEDDVHVSNQLPAFFSVFANCKSLPFESDIIKLDTMNELIEVDRTAILSIAGIDLSWLRSTHWGAAGYLLSSSVATKLLSLTNSNFILADMIFSGDILEKWKLEVLQCIPALVIQDQSALLFKIKKNGLGSNIDDLYVAREGRKYLPDNIEESALKKIVAGLTFSNFLPKLFRFIIRLWLKIYSPILSLCLGRKKMRVPFLQN